MPAIWIDEIAITEHARATREVFEDELWASTLVHELAHVFESEPDAEPAVGAAVANAEALRSFRLSLPRRMALSQFSHRSGATARISFGLHFTFGRVLLG